MRRVLLASWFLALGCTSAGADTPSGETDALDYAAEAEPGLAPWAYEYEAEAEFGGIGSLHAKSAEGGISSPLQLRSLDVRVENAGQLAAFEVEHVFHNDSEERLEGTFRFTLPPGAIVTGLAMQIGDELMEGEILAREKAQRIYQDIVDSMRDPAILEWEQGRTFKLRVFPIEAMADKRLVLRYLAPLAPDPRREEGYRIIYPTVAPEGQALIGRFRLSINDQVVTERRDFEARGDLRVPLPTASTAPDLVVERRGDLDYYAARVRPRWANLPAQAPQKGARTRVLWVDSSRSALESWDLAIEAAMSLIGELGPEDEFLLMTADLFATVHSGGLTAPTPQSLEQAELALRAVRPDGASDFSAALNEIGAQLEGAEHERVEVIYIGDGTPTWGTHDTAELAVRAETALGRASFHALALGRGADRPALETLVAGHQGRVAQPQGPTDLRRFATFMRYADRIKSVHEMRVSLEGELAQTHLAHAQPTLFEGNEGYVYFTLPASAAAPTRLKLSGRVAGQDYEDTLSLPSALPSEHVASLWAAARIEELQAQGDNQDEVVHLSETYGVLSRHTALLVLESEEAYQQHQIERRKAAEAAEREARISGRDLESMGSDAHLAPGDIQPGDPEIHIPAPRDARSVSVTFPFGETKIAEWDENLGQWNVRFLIDAATASGRYEVLIRIVHADGTVETRKADYTVDTSAPHMSLQLRELEDEPGVYLVIATQEVHEEDHARLENRVGYETLDDETRWSGLDAKSVDLVMPDGQTLTLRREAAGRFEKRWTPQGATSWPAQVRMSATDRALNVRHSMVELAAPMTQETR